MDRKYDVCLISFSNPFTDARTLNLANTLSKSQKVIVIALKSNNNNLNSKFELLTIDLNFKKSSWRNWLSFDIKIKNTNINANIFIACDLYSLTSARLLSKKTNSKLIYDSREIYSKLASLSKNKIKQFVITQIEKHFIKKIDKIIVSGELDKEYLINHFKKQVTQDYVIIKNFPPYKEIVKSNKLRKLLNISEDKLILLYQGAVLEGRGLIPILKALIENDKYYLVIIGEGIFKKALEEFVFKNSLTNKVTFLGEVSYLDLHNYTCSADLGICLFEPISKSYELALPNKLFEYMMAGLPCIASDLPAINEVLIENKNGIIIKDVNDINEINETLELFSNFHFRINISQNAEKARANYSYEIQESLILSLLN